MLRVSLIGNMGGEPDVRYTSTGRQTVSLSVAVNQVRTGPDGERQENTEWFRVRIGQPKMQDFVQRLTRGTRVLAVGRLDISHYQSRTGELRTGYDVWADELQVLSPRPAGQAEPYPAPADADAPVGDDDDPQPVAAVPRGRAPARNGTASAAAPEEGGGGDELPF